MNYIVDWSANREAWPDLLGGFAGKPRLRFLEIGCFEGQTTLWLLDNILLHKDSSITVVDMFGGVFDGITEPDYPTRFKTNVAAHNAKVIEKPGRSSDVLPTLRGTFDFVYIDGSHDEQDVWSDATLAWPLLRAKGIVVFDDYQGREGVRSAVDRFVVEHADAAEWRSTSQYTVVKL